MMLFFSRKCKIQKLLRCCDTERAVCCQCPWNNSNDMRRIPKFGKPLISHMTCGCQWSPIPLGQQRQMLNPQQQKICPPISRYGSERPCPYLILKLMSQYFENGETFNILGPSPLRSRLIQNRVTQKSCFYAVFHCCDLFRQFFGGLLRCEPKPHFRIVW